VIRFHCDVCSKEMRTSETVTISTKTTIADYESKIPSQQGREFSIDVCSLGCLVKAFHKLMKEVQTKGSLPE